LPYSPFPAMLSSMTTNRENLKLTSDSIVSVAANLDFDDELLITIECDCELDRYLTLDEMRELRDHLDNLLQPNGL